MNTRSSAIATSVYVLVTVMPKYSRSILSSILQGKPRSGGTGAGPYTENGTQYPGLVYSEVNTSSPSAQAESPAPFCLRSQNQNGPVFISTLATRPEAGAISALVSEAAVALMCRLRHHNGE